jgi:ubiquinone/menaquinone biosynthesis C-methylase UbiE
MVGWARGKARRRRSRATFEVAAAEALPFPDAAVDVVTVSLVLYVLARRGD